MLWSRHGGPIPHPTCWICTGKGNVIACSSPSLFYPGLGAGGGQCRPSPALLAPSPAVLSAVTGSLALPQGDEADGEEEVMVLQVCGLARILQAILKVIPDLCNIMVILFISMPVNGWEMPAWTGRIGLEKHLGHQGPALAMAPQGPWGKQAQSQQQDGPFPPHWSIPTPRQAQGCWRGAFSSQHRG